MMQNVRINNKGITLLALVITIIILSIIVGISMKYGMDAITYTTFQNTKTNMLLIEAKAKEYVENANYKLGIRPQEATEEMRAAAKEELKGTLLTNLEVLGTRVQDIGISEEDVLAGNVYKLTTEDLEKMSIRGVESNDEKGWYIILYNITAKIYYTYGVKVGKEIKYALDDIRDVNVNDQKDVSEKNNVSDQNDVNIQKEE